MGADQRIFWTKTVTAAGLMAGLLLSANLWAGARSFPRVPVLGNVPPLPSQLETALFVLLLFALTAVVVSPRPRKFIFTALAAALLLAFFDQMRWQPWFFQYLFMLAALGSFSWGRPDANARDAALDSCRIIVAGLYFYSGLQKMNPVFTGSLFPWMIEPMTSLFALRPSLLFTLGTLVPFIEIGIGVGLLSKKFRNHAIALAALTSAFVLSMLGPWGHDWNSVVWPWNVAMAAFAIILFWRTEAIFFDRFLWKRAFPIQKIVIFVFAILPALSFFNLWDSYLSASLYSGNTAAASVYVSDSVEGALPASMRRRAVTGAPYGHDLDLFGWSFDELHVPPYPEKRVFKGIARTICGYSENGDGVLLVVTGKTTLLGGGKTSKYDCQSLRHGTWFQ